jgi:hypothetical protein
MSAEQEIAGAIMHDAAFVVAAIRAAELQPRELPLPEREIISAGVALHDEGTRVDAQALERRLISEGVVDTLNCRGGAGYIYQLYLSTVTPYTVAYQIRRLRRDNIVRLTAALKVVP